MKHLQKHQCPEGRDRDLTAKYCPPGPHERHILLGCALRVSPVLSSAHVLECRKGRLSRNKIEGITVLAARRSLLQKLVGSLRWLVGPSIVLQPGPELGAQPAELNRSCFLDPRGSGKGIHVRI